MAVIGATTQSEGLLNLIDHRASCKKQTPKHKAQELLQRMEALRTNISTLRQECETIKSTMKKPEDTIQCLKCGQPTKRNEAFTFKSNAEQKALCKKCFTELWK